MKRVYLTMNCMTGSDSFLDRSVIRGEYYERGFEYATTAGSFGALDAPEFVVSGSAAEYGSGEGYFDAFVAPTARCREW
jgi:hypothetical protein